MLDLQLKKEEKLLSLTPEKNKQMKKKQRLSKKQSLSCQKINNLSRKLSSQRLKKSLRTKLLKQNSQKKSNKSLSTILKNDRKIKRILFNKSYLRREKSKSKYRYQSTDKQCYKRHKRYQSMRWTTKLRDRRVRKRKKWYLKKILDIRYPCEFILNLFFS